MASRFRSLLVKVLALWYDITQKQLCAALRMTQKALSQHLKRGEVKDDLFERLLEAMNARPSAVRLLEGSLEGLELLHQAEDLSEDELVVIEEAAQDHARRVRDGLMKMARLSRTVVSDGYPGPLDLVPLRRRAEELWARLKKLPAELREEVVEGGEEFQSWSLCEKVCELSVREASRKVQRAAALARLALKIAEKVRGPEWWRNRVLGYAMAHVANIRRVAGHLKEAETLLEEAKRLWEAGDDPAGVLDPGRLLDIEGALRRDQRRFSEALDCLDEAVKVSRFPERALIMKGFTQEVMGEYEEAIRTLLQASPLVDRVAEPRQGNVLNINLAVNFCHVGRFSEADKLVPQMRSIAIELGDEIDLARIDWIQGRSAAGQGRIVEARMLLEKARRKFAAEKMSYDVALALLEEAVLLLHEGRSVEVKLLAEELTEVFKSKGVHREALASLRLFQKAVESEMATIELARRVIRYLYRARYDQGLPFTSS